MSVSVTIAATENHDDIEVAVTGGIAGSCTIRGFVECGDEYFEFDGVESVDVGWEVVKPLAERVRLDAREAFTIHEWLAVCAGSEEFSLVDALYSAVDSAGRMDAADLAVWAERHGLAGEVA